MDIIIQIQGREAIPVRAIPYVTGWRSPCGITPQELVNCLGLLPANRTQSDGLRNLSAYKHLSEKSVTVPPDEWAMVAAQLAAISTKLKIEYPADNEGRRSDVGYEAWQARSIETIPSATFVWLDELERDFQMYFDFRACAAPSGSMGSRELNLVQSTLPESVRRLIMEGLEDTPTGTAPSQATLSPRSVEDATNDPCAVFRAMSNLDASELRIIFVGDKTASGMGGNNSLEITARGITKRIPFSMLDLVDRRQTRLNSQGAILLGFARGKNLFYSVNNSKKISRLTKAFRQKLGISGKLTRPYSQEMGYEPLCTLIDNTGAGDERAKKKGEYRTDSSDENQEEKRVLMSARDRNKELNDRDADARTNAWLSKNEPSYKRDKSLLS